ncbi:MAG: diaminopimelate epimerase [Micromonosporaceae bacterium]|nr:diaminopimelate epimerase [Micromonosporaceae bacterium]
MVAMDIKGLPFAKGHGTGNDFVIVPDPDGELNLPADLVVALCDRRRGLGADGLLRVVRTGAHPEVAGRAAEAEWFMDYRNADGSLAEMCGNGVRVFARYLVEAGLAFGGTVPILTRAGRVVAEIGEDTIAVDMPLPEVFAGTVARVSGVDFPGTVATCGNPNLVCRVDDPDAVDLARAPLLDPAVFPAGANVEFVTPVSALHVRMRVVERGVGETLSCGSGACAVAAVVLRDAALDAGTVTVDVPGGRLTVMLDTGRCVLSGPAVIVAAGTVRTAP